MHLKSGDTAPLFDTVTMDGRPIRLSDFRGRKLLLAIYQWLAQTSSEKDVA